MAQFFFGCYTWVQVSNTPGELINPTKWPPTKNEFTVNVQFVALSPLFSCALASYTSRLVSALLLQPEAIPGNNPHIVFARLRYVKRIFYFLPFLTVPETSPLACHPVSSSRRLGKNRPFTDLLVFLIIIWVGRRSRGLGPPGTRTILDKIVRDGTVYFLVIFTSHLVVECFILFASVSH